MDPLVWSIILLALAIAFIFLEMLIPSGGILGVLAGASAIASVAIAFTRGVGAGTTMLVVALVVMPAMIAIAIRWWPDTPIGRLVMLQRPEADDVLPDTPEYRDIKMMIGSRGTAKSKMLPSGSILIGQKTYDAVSDGVAIDPGQAVIVTAIRNNRIVVRPDDSITTATYADDDMLSQPIDSLGIEQSDDPLA